MAKPLPIIRVRSLEHKALERYREGPKLPTVFHAADTGRSDDFHCVPVCPEGPPKPGTNPFQRDFAVPKQEVRMVEDPEYGLFTITRVQDGQNGPTYLLVMSVKDRIGFLLRPEDCVVEERELERPAFKELGRVMSHGWASAAC